ncbi:hypothetical protein O5D80_004497 [Batrachochytrium dendrobatidis]|nr:hypothetical protein O5D80_004497 [Batrachochytrium dendrobatidis]
MIWFTARFLTLKTNQESSERLRGLKLYDAKFQIQPASTCLGTNPYTSVVSVPIPAVGPNTGRKTGSQIALPTNRNTGPNSKSAGILGQSPSTASLVAGLSVLASLGLQSIC